MKYAIVTAMFLAAGAAEAKPMPTIVDVEDVYVTQINQEPFNARVCTKVQVPIYGTVQRNGDAGAGALGGMIIGGILGKGITGKDDGAAAGAVLGGIIGANNATKNEKIITGYTTENRCENVTRYKEVTTRHYDHTVLTMKYNGYTYTLEFIDITK